MKKVKEFTIKLSEDNKTPIVEIDGEKLSGITNLKVKYNSDDAHYEKSDKAATTIGYGCSKRHKVESEYDAGLLGFSFYSRRKQTLTKGHPRYWG